VQQSILVGWVIVTFFLASAPTGSLPGTINIL
jgi:hypothetical protein